MRYTFRQSGTARNERHLFEEDQRRLRRVGMAVRRVWGMGKMPQHVEPFLLAQ